MKTPLPFALALSAALLAAPAASAQTCADNDAADTDVTAAFDNVTLFTGAADGLPRLSVDLVLKPALPFGLGGASLFYLYDNDALDFERLTFAPFVTQNSCYLPLGANSDNGRTNAGVIISPGCNPTGGTAGSALTSSPVVIATATYLVRDPAARVAFVFTNAVTNDDTGQSCRTESQSLFSQELPVELTRFEARGDGAGAVLTWATAGETNNAGFAVEHRAEASAWREVGFVSGAGTTGEAQRYRYRVPALAPGAHRFRLKQVDFDGAATLGPEIELTVEPHTHPTLIVGPNPASAQASLVFTLPHTDEARLSVYDVTGREVARLYEGVAAAGVHEVGLDAAALAAGVYVCRLTTPTGTVAQVLTIAR